MNLKNQLLESLEEQLRIEKLSINIYGGFTKKTNNVKIINTIKNIIKDEVDHVEIVKNLLELINSYKGSIGEYKKSIKETKTNGKYKIKHVVEHILESGSSSLLLLSNVENYMMDIINVLEQMPKKKEIIYVSYNKIPKYIKKLLGVSKIDVNKVLFINCVGAGEDKKDINIGPQELTHLAITIKESIEKMNEVVILVDTISAFSVYNEIDTIAKFVASINDFVRKEDKSIIWVAINDPEERALNSRISTLCDSVIKV